MIPRRMYVWLAAFAAAALLAVGYWAGSAQDATTSEPNTTAPVDQKAPEPAPAPPASAPADQPVPIVGVQFADNLSEKAVPLGLLDWVATQKERTGTAFKVLTEGDATFIAVTGGKQPGGGYTLELVSYQLPAPGGKPVVTLNLKVRAPQAGEATTGPNPPVRYFRLTPQLVGQVVVNFGPGN